MNDESFCKWIEALPYSELITGEGYKPITLADRSRGTGLWQPGDDF